MPPPKPKEDATPEINEDASRLRGQLSKFVSRFAVVFTCDDYSRSPGFASLQAANHDGDAMRELLIDDLVRLWARQRFTGVYITHNLAEAVRLGHRIAVLSRRPGRVREVIEIATDLDARQPDDPDLARTQRHLWRMMRDEAAAADRELA